MDRKGGAQPISLTEEGGGKRRCGVRVQGKGTATGKGKEVAILRREKTSGQGEGRKGGGGRFLRTKGKKDYFGGRGMLSRHPARSELGDPKKRKLLTCHAQKKNIQPREFR